MCASGSSSGSVAPVWELLALSAYAGGAIRFALGSLAADTDAGTVEALMSFKLVDGNPEEPRAGLQLRAAVV